MSEIITIARCLNCGKEWSESLFDYITPRNARRVLTELADYFENLRCPDCNSDQIEIGGSAQWD